jgi:hypothetical protein
MGQADRERVRSVLAWEHSAPVPLAAYDRLWHQGRRVVDLDRAPEHTGRSARLHQAVIGRQAAAS